MRFQARANTLILLICFWLAVSTFAHATLWEDNWNRTDADIEGECKPPAGVPIEEWECGDLGYQPPVCENLPNRYRTFHSALACAHHPSACVATDPAKRLLRFHGEDIWFNGLGWEGFPMISKQTFTKGGYISAEVRVRAYCGPTLGSGCFFSLALYNGESNYRAIAYQANKQSSGTPPMEVWRYAGGACNPSVLKTASGAIISVGQGTYHTLRLDYYGNEGGKWVYFLDNVVRQIENANAGNEGSVLQAHPRAGLFFVGSQDGAYVEGDLGPLRVWTGSYEDARQTSQADGFAATQTMWFAQEVYMGGTVQNITKVRPYLVHGHRYKIAAYTDALGGKPGTLINETFYTADRPGFQDVPLWVPQRYAKIWIRIAAHQVSRAEFGTSAPGTNPYAGKLLRSDNQGSSWVPVDRDMSFITYERR